VFEDPFTNDDIGANRTRDEISSVVSDQSIIFFFYGMTSGRVGEGSTDEGGHQREQQ
jgi:hypothetical protein